MTPALRDPTRQLKALLQGLELGPFGLKLVFWSHPWHLPVVRWVVESQGGRWVLHEPGAGVIPDSDTVRGVFVAPETSGEPDWPLLRRLNVTRDRLLAQGTGALLLALPVGWYDALSQMAPDLWSVRSAVVEFPPLSPLDTWLRDLPPAPVGDAALPHRGRVDAMRAVEQAAAVALAWLDRGDAERARQVCLAWLAPRMQDVHQDAEDVLALARELDALRGQPGPFLAQQVLLAAIAGKRTEGDRFRQLHRALRDLAREDPWRLEPSRFFHRLGQALQHHQTKAATDLWRAVGGAIWDARGDGSS